MLPYPTLTCPWSRLPTACSHPRQQELTGPTPGPGLHPLRHVCGSLPRKPATTAACSGLPKARNLRKLEHHNLFDCIECGACSFACPSNIPLVQYYRAAKAEVLQLRKDAEKSEHSRIRFEARQTRLEREDAEKEAKRAARKKAAEATARTRRLNEGEH